ncbi:ABC transporter substrate-binding protein [Comamonas sp. B21-038]|uniref:ABC transporter substrate-binding protein n=1 Tax=Comamonas sp. B21-038 TaxID=2918299 RepID=UPI001EFA9933|nr:ABC transporter substrate-binding protein [Comamonas sp. B21-038]ULR90019.1 ABC transporter substrate-binding protein [Comamonas sp. B21-038]
MTYEKAPQHFTAPVSRRLALTLGGGLVGLVLAACSKTEPAPAPAASAAGASAAPAAQAEPVRGGQLVVAIRAEPAQLNPLVDQGSGAHSVRPALDSLVWDNGDGTHAPWLASSWEVSDDATTYVFHLRKDVHFHDGTPFNAAAVKANFDYVNNPANKSTGSTAKLKPVATVIDEYTVSVKLGTPESSFLTLIAAPYFGILSQQQIEQDPKSLATKLIGTGPFKFDSWVKGQSLTYVRNDDYQWAPAQFHAGAAYLDSVKYVFLPEDQTRYNALTTKEAHVVDYIAPEYAKSVKQSADYQNEEFLLPGVGYSLHFNTRRAPFDKLEVRQALLHGLNREEIVASATFGAYPVQEYLASTTPDFNKELKNKISYDADKANRLLDEAGWGTRDAQGYRSKDGQRLSASIPYADNDQLAQRTLEQVQIDARKLGFEIKLQPVTDLPERLYNGNYGLLGTFQSEATGMQLWRLYGSDNISDGSTVGSNASFLSIPELDALLAKARASGKSPDRARYYAQAQEILPNYAPSVPLYSRARLVAIQKNVHGVAWDKAWPQPYLFDAWIGK